MPDEIAIAKYINLAERVSKPNKLSEVKERAERLALSIKKDVGVKQWGKDHYELYPMSICGKSAIYVAEYKGGRE